MTRASHCQRRPCRHRAAPILSRQRPALDGERDRNDRRLPQQRGVGNRARRASRRRPKRSGSGCGRRRPLRHHEAGPLARFVVAGIGMLPLPETPLIMRLIALRISMPGKQRPLEERKAAFVATDKAARQTIDADIQSLRKKTAQLKARRLAKEQRENKPPMKPM